MNYWLLKSEPEEFSLEHLKKVKKEAWTGVRNYSARNFMRQMKVGDLCLFYYSSTKDTGIYGLAKVVAEAHPDLSAQDKKSDYFDSKATKEKPIWYCVDVAYVEKFKKPLLLTGIKKDQKLSDMMLLSRGRLSVQPVSRKHFAYILSLCEGSSR